MGPVAACLIYVGAVEKLAAEGFNTLAEVLEAELTADDLGELGLDAEEAQKFQAAIAAADGSPPPPAAVPLSSWLAELDLSDSLEKFEAEGFATLGEVVEAELTEDDLKELGLGMKARKLIVLELKKLEEEAAAAEAVRLARHQPPTHAHAGKAHTRARAAPRRRSPPRNSRWCGTRRRRRPRKSPRCPRSKWMTSLSFPTAARWSARTRGERSSRPPYAPRRSRP